MVIGIEKIWVSVVMVYLIAKSIKFLVALREKWHNGSKAKHEAKKAKIEIRYLEHKLKCRKRLTNKPTGRKAKADTYYTKTIQSYKKGAKHKCLTP